MVDAHAVSELKLYIDNDGDLYRRQTTSILKNLMTKCARGVYKHDLAVKLFGYLVEEGAKKYAQEFGSPSQPWHKMFDVKTRKEVAEELTRDFEREAALSNYDQLLPKKYEKPKVPGTGHARKKGPPSRRSSGEHRVSSSLSSGVAAQDIREFRGFLHRASDSQVQGIYEKEKRSGRDEYAELAVAEADRRGISLGHYSHARRDSLARSSYRAEGPRSRAQLDHDIEQALGSQAFSLYRGRR